MGEKTGASEVGLGAGASAAAAFWTVAMAATATKMTAKNLSFKDSIFYSFSSFLSLFFFSFSGCFVLNLRFRFGREKKRN